MTIENEKDRAYRILVDNALSGPGCIMRPDSYQRLLILGMEQHRVATGLDVQHLLERFGVSWILLALTVEVRRPLRFNEYLTLHTWGTERERLVFRRELSFLDDGGEEVMAAVKFDGTFDCRSRRICRDEAILSALTLPEGEKLIEAHSRETIDLAEFTEVETRTVPPCYIDLLGHVNNTRYGELIYDAMPAALRPELTHLKRFELYFVHEIRPDDTITLYLREEGSCTQIAACKAGSGALAFSSRLYF